MFNRFQSVFVHGRFQYVGKGESTRPWIDAGVTEVIPIAPCEQGYLFNCCIVIPFPLGVSERTPLFPTSCLQHFLTERSSSHGDHYALCDINLQLECIGTNGSDTHEYSKNRVMFFFPFYNKNNRVFFTHTLSLNALLQLPGMRYVQRGLNQFDEGNTTSGITERLSDVMPSTLNETPVHSSSLQDSSSFDLYR